MDKSMEVKDMVEYYLKAHKFDGLFSEDCGCMLPDIIPCGFDIDIVKYCKAGYRKDCDCAMGCDFHIGLKE